MTLQDHSWGPWHKPREYFSVPAYWDPEIQDAIAAKGRSVKIIDCTLSEGEDMVGRHLSWAARIRLAHMLDELGVGEITTPIGLSPRELKDWVRACKRGGIETPICDKLIAHVLPLEKGDWKKRYDDHLACEADTFVTFPYYPQISYWSDFTKGPFTKDQVVDAIHETVSYGVERDAQIIFSFPDSFRHSVETIKLFCKAGVDAGAMGIYIYDSRGQSNPRASYLICREIKETIGDVNLYVQHHNDLGMATANSLAAAEAGADFIDAAMNGVGDRSGTAALEEVACALYAYGWDAGVRLDKLLPLAEEVERAFGGRISDAIKPIIGWQANMEEGYGHRDPDDPPESPMAIAGEVLGKPFESVIGPNVFGKIHYIQPEGLHKHKEIIADFIGELGFECSNEDLEEVRNRTKDALLGRAEGYITIGELKLIVEGVLGAND